MIRRFSSFETGVGVLLLLAGCASMPPGQASIGEARALIEEGVPVLPVPPSPDEYN